MAFSGAAADDKNESSYFTALYEFMDQLRYYNFCRKNHIDINLTVCLSLYKKCRMSFQSYLTSHIL
jgi:hypothetical protein